MDLVAQLNASLVGRYALDREIGRGGMATVYLARDLRHDRRVALKVLSPELAAVVGSERFLAEIKVTAGLSHPNLLPLFDSGEADGHLFYAMPFVDGESLRARLTREKQLPIDEALRIATAIAGALDYAHRHGVIHRDLKPENILLQDGQPLVADFGIALALSNAGGSRITQTGLSLGTPQYMSPEQATGDRAIDGRTDIYSLGAVVYEMLTGEPPHTGATSAAIIARLITDKPRPVRQTRDSVPLHVDAAVERALAKLPADRFPTGSGFVDALEGRGPAVVPPSKYQPTRRWFHSAVWPAVSVVMTAAAVWARMGDRHAQQEIMRFTIPLEGTDGSWVMTRGNPLAISPDGKRVVFLKGGSIQRLFVRSLDDTHSRVLPGTETAYDPVFSPDGRSVAFIGTGDRLAKVPVDGGTVLTIADFASSAPSFWGIDWGTNDSIAISVNGRIATVAGSATPGTLHWLTAPDSARRTMRIWPRWSPDGRWLLFVEAQGSRSNARIVARSARDGRMAPLAVSGIMPLGFIDDHLIYCSSSGEFMAVPFNSRTGDTAGTPTQLGDSAVGGTSFNKAALSRSGSLAFMTGAFVREVVGLDLAQLSTRTVVAGRHAYTSLRMSPNGTRIALSVQSAVQEQISVYDLASRTTTLLSPVGIVSQRPEWTPDSKRVIYRFFDEGEVSQLQWQVADGSRAPEPLLPGVHNVWEGVLSPDGRTVAYRTGVVGAATISLQRLDSGSTQPRSIGSKGMDAWGARFSRDGRWLAYSSSRGGSRQVFVEPASGEGSVVQISDEDGSDTPVWSPDGHRLFYMINGERIVMATLDPGPPLRVLDRKTVVNGGYFLTTGHAGFDVAAGGKELLLLKTVTSDAELVVAYNWREQVRARLRAATTSQKR